jgi:tetratricopeptide (TPR) repeat protein
MAYNKSKHVEAAQKLLNQGKVAQAIAEYQQILKHEPRDQVTLMTVGELYIRQGETFQAIDYFERLAQIFVGDGFLTKAIAVYKRIAKLAPEEIRPLEKLADLYVQQGVMSEARPLFLQLAEVHLKNNRQAEAVALLKKLLAAEPDNLRVQIRLADLYQAMGQNDEAVAAFVSAAQRALARGDHGECEKLIEKAVKIDPKGLPAMIVKARIYSSQGDLAKAAQVLEQVHDLEKGGEQTELLLDLYLRSLNWEQATRLAERVFEADPKNFGPTQKVVEALLESGQGERALTILASAHIPMIDAGEHEVVAKMLNELAARLPGRIEPLEWLVDVYGRTSDSFRLPDALANLGDALVAQKQYERAKEIFEKLVDREPESDSAKRKLNDVLRQLGVATPEPAAAAPPEALQTELPKAEAPKIRPDVAPPAPEVHAKPASPAVDVPLDEDTEKFIAQSLTDVDLFASYGLTQKAIGLLEAILRRAPRHTPTLEKLLDFVLGAGDDRRTAELAAQLEQIHKDRGDARGAERFGELRRRFQRAAGLTDEELAAATVSAEPAPTAIPEAQAESVPAEMAIPAPSGGGHDEFVIEEVAVVSSEPEVAPARVSQEVHEVDLSDEWASLLEETKPVEPPSPKAAPPAPKPTQPANTGPSIPPAQVPPPAPSPAGTPAFDLSAFTEFLAPGAPASEPPPSAPSSPMAADHPFAEISAELPVAEEMPSAPFEDIFEIAPAAAGETPIEPPVEEGPIHTLDIEEPVSPTSVFSEPPVEELPATGVPAEEPKDPAFELQLEAQEVKLDLQPEALVPAYDQKPPAEPVRPHSPEPVHEPEPVEQNARSAPAPQAPAHAMDSDQFLADLANEVGDLAPMLSEPAAAPHPHAAAPTPPKAAGESGPLKEVFDDFRAELGEMGGAEDEDLETHYNLGTAFREMGLLEEAISEFQKVAKAVENGRPFRYGMQCSTLLGLTFMDKGQPAIAAIWYERALRTPGIEPETALALRYDLGVAQESAGESEAALKSFFQVYAVNIDYRDVGERIAALQKAPR